MNDAARFPEAPAIEPHLGGGPVVRDHADDQRAEVLDRSVNPGEQVADMEGAAPKLRMHNEHALGKAGGFSVPVGLAVVEPGTSLDHVLADDADDAVVE